jgi:putative selenate reductase molybdopterin-binding subunit
MTRKTTVVGQSVDKIDALSLATGRALFVADEVPRGTLHAAVLPSPHAHALIRKIDASKARALAGVHAVLTHEDVPRVAHTTAGQGFPEPSPYDTFVLDRKVRFVGDRVAAVAAESPEIAREALGLIEVEFDVLDPVLDPRAALEAGAPVIHDEPEARAVIPVEYEPSRNLAARVATEVGDCDAALARSAHVHEAEYEAHYAQHCPIEPHVCVSFLDERGRLVIRTSTQVPFHVRRIVAQALQLPVRAVRVVKPRIGGGFGAKQEVLIEPLCAALTLATKRPVLYELTRAEEFLSRTRHPQVLRVRMGADAKGRITAIDLDVLMNSGAYGAHALTVACNSGSKVLPLYPCDDVKFRARTAYTNLPVGGAYRGYGATQAAFAMECHVDDLADKAGIDPVEMRRLNHIRSGGTSPIFAALGEGKPGVEQSIGSCGLAECIDRGAAAIGWSEKRSRRDEGPVKRGVGMALLMQGSSIPEIDMGAATIKLNDDGSVNLLVGATDLGTGSDTVLAQVVAEVLGIGVEDVLVLSSDTDTTPFDVGAYASSTTYLSGMAAKKAAEDVAAQIRAVAARMLGGAHAPDTLRLEGGRVVAPDGKAKTVAEVALHSLYVADQEQIAATRSHVSHRSPPPFSAHFADVAVDTETGQIKVLAYVAAVDCGTAINPALAEGQIEGAVLNGLSYALTEQYLFDTRGRMTNASFRDYKIWTTRDLPEIQAILVPTYEETGPFGAKSVSEIGINGALPAISNAVKHATGVRLRRPPFTPPRVLAALRAEGDGRSA